jgi:predicted RNA polymerase sigma factor
MTKQNKASEFAERALNLWGDGRLAEAAADFRDAIRLSEQGDYRITDYRGSLGSILAELGLDEDALSEFVSALRIAIDNYHDDSSPVVSVSRYFLAEHLLKMHREEDALSCIAPSLHKASGQEAILRAVEAECLWRLDRRGDAKSAARRAVTTAQSDEQREGICERLEYILTGSGESWPDQT